MKEIIWVRSSKEDLSEFPEDVRDEIGFALYKAQQGLKPQNVKPLTGISGGVMEVISDFDKSTFRAVYAVKLGDYIYVLHCFQKNQNKA